MGLQGSERKGDGREPGTAPTSPRSCRATRTHPSHSFPQTQASPSPALPTPTPTPPHPPRKLQQPPRMLVRGAEAPAVPIQTRGEGTPASPLPALSPFPVAALAHSPIPIYGHGCERRLLEGRSPVLEGDQQPGIQDVLLGFPRVISCKGKGRGTRRKKKNRASFAASRWGMT